MMGVKSSMERSLSTNEKDTLEILRDESNDRNRKTYLDLFLSDAQEKKHYYLPPLPAHLPGQFQTRDEAVDFLKANDHIQWHALIAPNNMRLCPSHVNKSEQKLSRGQIILACDLQR